MRISTSILMALFLFSVTCWANIRLPDDPNKPRTRKAVDTTLSIRLDRDAKEARLLIPKSQIKQLRAELDHLDSDPGPTASAGITKIQTIVSGIFLSLAIVFAGIWFTRSGKHLTKTGKAIGAAAVVMLTGSFAVFVFANAGPPPDARSITGRIFAAPVHTYKFASGKIKLEVTDDENRVQLIVPDPQPDPRPGEE